MIDTCVCCGSYVPEGRMVCFNCEKKYEEEAGTNNSDTEYSNHSSVTQKSATENKTLNIDISC